MKPAFASSLEPRPAPRKVEVSVRGKWLMVPAVDVDGQTIVVRGRWIKIARLHDEDYADATVRDPARCIDDLRRRAAGARADIFCFSQKEPDVEPHYNFPMEMRSLAVADVSSVEAWWQRVSHGTKCNIRQSKKRGVEVRVEAFSDDLIRGIMSIQNESPVRQGRRFYHFGKTFEQARRDHASYLDTCDFVCARHGEEMIGFLKLVYRGNVASIMQLNSKLTRQSMRPANALLAHAVERCAARGISYLNYGDFNLWNKRESTLRDFKVRNGFGEMLVPTYYVPLTLWGWLCVRLRLYRGLLGILPGSAITAGLELRRQWYSARARLDKNKPADLNESLVGH